MMYLFDFTSKLKRLNPLLYIDTSEYVMVPGTSIKTAQMYLRRPKRKKYVHGARGVGNSALQSYIRETEAGLDDEPVMRITLGWLPEHTRFNLERGSIELRGWRDALNGLVKKSLIDLDKARRVFGCSSLGQSTWDKMDYDRKLAWAREGTKYA